MNKDSFLEYEFEKIPDAVRKVVPENILRDNLILRINNRLKYISTGGDAERIMKIVKHENRVSEDYGFHLSEVSEDKFAFSKINFEDMDAGRPFVNILLKNFDIAEASAQDEFKNFFFEKYGRFKPAYMEFFEYYDSTNSNKKIGFDNFVAGHIDSIKKLPFPERYAEVEIEKTNDTSFYGKYFEEYTRLRKEIEMFAHEAIISEEDFDYYMKDGIINKIMIGNEFAGLHAVHREKRLCFDGYYVIEQVLFKEFRGKNFAASMQRKVIDSIDAKNHEYIYGDIFTHNKASMHTAVKTGRVIAGSKYKINF